MIIFMHFNKKIHKIVVVLTVSTYVYVDRDQQVMRGKVQLQSVKLKIQKMLKKV